MRTLGIPLLLLLAAPVLAQEAPGGPDTGGPVTGEPAAGSVQVVNRGEEPRQALRYTWKKGTKQRAIMELDIAVTVSGMPQPVPSQKHTLDVEIVDVADNGDATIVMTFTKVELKGNPNPMMQAAMAKLEGAKITSVVSRSGKAGTMTIEGVKDPQLRMILDNMKRTMKDSFFEFPSGKLGVGATWTRTRRVETNGLKMDSTDTYKVTRIEDGVVTLAVSGVQSAPKQKFQAPGAPMPMNLTAFKGAVKGGMTVGLRRPMPVKSSADVKVEMTMDAGMGAMEIVNRTKVAIREVATTPDGGAADGADDEAEEASGN